MTHRCYCMTYFLLGYNIAEGKMICLPFSCHLIRGSSWATEAECRQIWQVGGDLGNSITAGTEGLLRSSRSIYRDLQVLQVWKTVCRHLERIISNLPQFRQPLKRFCSKGEAWVKECSFQKHSRLMTAKYRRLAFNSISTLIYSEHCTKNILTCSLIEPNLKD